MFRDNAVEQITTTYEIFLQKKRLQTDVKGLQISLRPDNSLLIYHKKLPNGLLIILNEFGVWEIKHIVINEGNIIQEEVGSYSTENTDTVLRAINHWILYYRHAFGLQKNS